MLNTEQITSYHQQGYLVVDQLFDQTILHKLKNRAVELVENWVDDDKSHTFGTENDDRSNDDYFLDSAEKVCCFFEDEAFDRNGQLVQSKEQSINKIGHALHELDSTFKSFSRSKTLGQIARDIGLQQPQIRQSMYIFKQPRIGGEVRWHQDATYFFTSPQSVVTFWIAVEDATLDNGCLWVEPGGQLGPLRERFERYGVTTTMNVLDKSPWPTIDQAVAVEVKAGSLVVFNGLLPHYSSANRSSKSRHAYTLHVTDGRAYYAEENWLQDLSLPLSGFE